MLSIGNPISGEHYDLYTIEETLENILDLLNDADIESVRDYFSILIRF